MTDAKAEELKALGNKYFQRGEFRQAISKYTEALNLSQNHVYYSNRAAAYLKLGKTSKALKDSNSCVKLAPTWFKGYLRQGTALQALHRYQEAIVAYQKGLEYDKHNSDIKTSLDHVMARQRKEEKQKKKIKSTKPISEPVHFFKASDFSDPKKVAKIVEQIGAHGTDLKKNAEDPLGDGDQSVLVSNGPNAKYLRELWSTGGGVAELCKSEELDRFAVNCVSGHRDGVQAALEVLTTAQKTNLLEKRRSIMRLSALWFPLLGHVYIRSYPPPDYIGTLKLLLEHGARPDARDICGKTFIHYASGPLCIDAMVFEMMDAVIEASKLTDREVLQEVRLVDLQDRFGEVALMLPVLKNRLNIVKHLCEIHGANGLLAQTACPSPLALSQYNRAMHTVISRAAENAEQNKLQRERHKKANIIVRPSSNHTFTTLMGSPSRAPFTQWEGAASTPSVPKGTHFDAKVQIGSCDGAILIHNETRDFCVYVEFENCDQKTELWRRVKSFNHFEGKRAYFRAKLKKGRLILNSEPFARDW